MHPDIREVSLSTRISILPSFGARHHAPNRFRSCPFYPLIGMLSPEPGRRKIGRSCSPAPARRFRLRARIVDWYNHLHARDGWILIHDPLRMPA